MGTRRRVALGGWIALAASLVGGCTAVLGDFSVGDAGGSDAGARDSTTGNDAGGDDSSTGSDTGGDDATTDATSLDAGSDASDSGSSDTGSGGDAGGSDAGDAGAVDAQPDGPGCTAGDTCDAGACVVASITCGDAGPVCTVTSNASPGYPCGTNQVCDGNGKCVAACSPSNCASGCCDPGTQLCVPYASESGTKCGHAGAQCHSCAVGTSTPACTTTDGTCAGTIIGQLAGYSDVIDIDSDGTNVYFADAANSQIGQASAHGLGATIALSPAIIGVTSVVYDTASSVVLFDAQPAGTTVGLYKATPGTANSAVQIAAESGGSSTTNGLTVSPIGSIDMLMAQTTTTSQAFTCSLTGCSKVLAQFTSASINGETWPASASEPFWADQANGHIVTWVQNCSCYQDVATGLTAPAAPTNDGTYLYWMQVSGSLVIQRTPIAGGSVQTLGKYGDNNQVQNLSTDGKYVYWSATVGGVSGIYYMPVGGGTAQLLTDAPAGMPVRVHKDSSNGQMVVYYGSTKDAAIDKVIAPP